MEISLNLPNISKIPWKIITGYMVLFLKKHVAKNTPMKNAKVICVTVASNKERFDKKFAMWAVPNIRLEVITDK